MRSRHGLLRSPVPGRRADEQEWSGIAPKLFLTDNCANQGGRSIQQAEVFSEYRGRGQSVQLDGTFPPAVSVHERLEKAVGSGMERLVIGVARNAVCVKRDDGVDRRLRCILGGGGRHVWGESSAEHIGDQPRGPCCRHGVGKVPGP